MKKFLKYFLVVILLSAGGIILSNKKQAREAVKTVSEKVDEAISQPCGRSLEYSIGAIDPKFGISREELIKISQEAEKIWEDSANKNLFGYNSQSEFKINLIFDERQQQTAEAEKLEEDLSSLEMSREILAKQYESIQSSYDKKMKAYEKALAECKNKLEEYNKKVEYWNERGGAPPEEYEELKDERREVKDLCDGLKDRQEEINKLAGRSSSLTKQENKIVNQYNANLTTYRNKYGGAREFEKGIFNGQAINIYQFQEESDLKLTLAHEFGHYLGFDHVENSRSIMYYLIGDQDLDNPAPTEQDLSQLKSVCHLEW